MKEIDGAKEYFKKLRLAEKFCDGDTELAKKLLTGEYKDIIVVKGRFKEQEDALYGLFIVIINKYFNSVIATYGIASHLASIYQHKPLEQWDAFYSGLAKELEVAEFDPGISSKITNGLRRFIEIHGTSDVIAWVEKNRIAEITEQFQHYLSEISDYADIQVMIDFEQTTSMKIYDTLKIEPQ